LPFKEDQKDSNTRLNDCQQWKYKPKSSGFPVVSGAFSACFLGTQIHPRQKRPWSRQASSPKPTQSERLTSRA